MNKKIVIMLAALMCVVSVILVSIYGQVPDFQTNILVSDIVVEGYIDKEGNLIPCEENTKGEKFIFIEDIEPGETTIVLKWTINPENASNPDVSFKVNVEDGSVVVSQQGIVTFYTADITKVSVVILPNDGGTDGVKITIMKPVDEEEEVVKPGVLPDLPF